MSVNNSGNISNKYMGVANSSQNKLNTRMSASIMPLPYKKPTMAEVARSFKKYTQTTKAIEEKEDYGFVVEDFFKDVSVEDLDYLSNKELADVDEIMPDDETSLAILMTEEPHGASEKVIAMWQKMKPLAIEQFDEFIKELDRDGKAFDPSVAEYAVWNDIDGAHCEGMRHKHTNRKHGLVRKVNTDGSFSEATWNDGQKIGARRKIYEDRVHILNRNGLTKFTKLVFDRDLQLILMTGKQDDRLKSLVEARDV